MHMKNRRLHGYIFVANFDLIIAFRLLNGISLPKYYVVTYYGHLVMLRTATADSIVIIVFNWILWFRQWYKGVLC